MEKTAGIRWRAASAANWTRWPLKYASGATKRASARSRSMAAKAVSISRLVLALRTSIDNPMPRAQPLWPHLVDEKIDPCRVAARPGKARDQTKPDRVFSDAEDDRDRRGRSFCPERDRGAAGRGDHRHAPANELAHQRRETIVLAL